MQTLGKYKIEAEIGRGAMGVVYRARDPQIDRLVAIKTIFLSSQEREDQAGFRERFFQEARAAGRLNHPGIVTIFDVGQDPDSGDPYIVMENVAGLSLSKVLALEGGKLPLGPALQLAQETAEALDYAHQQGVIHRDIKPGNILVTPDGHIKIADFGVARLNESEMTLPGQVIGSPAYMSPEQLRGEEVDARSDLFSLGVLLYRILTGYRPFQGNSVQTVAFKVANYEPMPVTSFESRLPGSVDAVVSRALAKDPKRRYQTALEFAGELARLRDEMGLTAETADQLSVVASPSTALPNATRGANPTSQAGGVRRPVSFVARKAIRRHSNLPTWLLYPASLVIVISASLALWMHFTLQPLSEMKLNAHLVAPAISKTETTQAALAGKPLLHPIAVSAHGAAAARKAADHGGSLLVEIDHPFQEGDASVWLDDLLVYDETLRQESRPLFFKKKTLSTHHLPVSSGKHTVRIRVAAPAEKYDASQTLAWTATSGQQNVLTVHCDKGHNLLTTSLK